MNTKILTLWFSSVSTILVLFGAMYVFFGLKILPVDSRVLLSWESALYGAIMMGWGVTLFLVGRIAIGRNDKDLMKALLYGVALWLFVEGLFSAHLHVWFNVGVDVGVLLLFSYPLVKALRSSQ